MAYQDENELHARVEPLADACDAVQRGFGETLDAVVAVLVMSLATVAIASLRVTEYPLACSKPVVAWAISQVKRNYAAAKEEVLRRMPNGA